MREDEMPQVRYDEARKIYRDCRFCKATNRRGCLACEGEAEKDYNRQFPSGAQPIATFKIADLESNAGGILDKLKGLIGPDAMMAAKDEARRKLEAPGFGSILRSIGGAGGGEMSEQEKEAIVAGMAGDIIAENFHKAGIGDNQDEETHP